MGLIIVSKPAAAGNYMQSRVWGGVNNSVSMLVIHTEQGFEAGTDSWFANPNSHVSAHYSCALNGEIHQHVSEGDTAYHAGNWTYNLRSIGIEHEDQDNPQGIARTDAQYQASAELVASICYRYGIPCERARIIGHREVPGNTHPGCPGNLNIDHIVQLAQAILANMPGRGGGTPPTGPTGGQEVFVSVQSLRVHTEPSTASPVVVQPNSPDGNLHEGQSFIMTDVVAGQDVDYSGSGGAHTNQWLKSSLGHFVWAGGTNYHFTTTPTAPTPPPTPPTPPPAPPVPVGGTVTVTVPALLLRAGPGTTFPIATGTDATGHPITKLLAGETVHYDRVVQGQAVAGNPYWLVSIHGNYFWSGGTNFRRPGRLGQLFHRNAANAYAVSKRAQVSVTGKKK